MFHAANFGQTSLFYNTKHELNPQIAGFTLERSLLNRLAAQFYLPETLKKTMLAPIAALHRWFDTEQAKIMELKQYLKENQAIIDWKKMASDSWSHADGGRLSLFCAFLINYIGPKQPLEQLLNQFLNSSELLQDRKHLHALSRILTLMPHRDVSALIFSSFASNPKVMDATLMQHMASFYQKRHLKSDQNKDPIQASIDLIRYFGQQKNYSATMQCCTLLKAQLPKGKLKKQIQKAQQEANLEHQLSFSLKSWFFKILSFFRRLWNYDKKPSSIVRFCDSKIIHPKIEVPEEIGIKHLGGKRVELEKKFLVNSSKLKTCRDKLLDGRKNACKSGATQMAQLGVFKQPDQGLVTPATSKNYCFR